MTKETVQWKMKKIKKIIAELFIKMDHSLVSK